MLESPGISKRGLSPSNLLRERSIQPTAREQQTLEATSSGHTYLELAWNPGIGTLHSGSSRSRRQCSPHPPSSAGSSENATNTKSHSRSTCLPQSKSSSSVRKPRVPVSSLSYSHHQFPQAQSFVRKPTPIRSTPLSPTPYELHIC